MHCTKHPHELAADVCGSCGLLWCRPCLTYPMGDRRPAMCMHCALVKAGIRPGKLRPPGRRELRRAVAELQAFLLHAPPGEELLPELHLPASAEAERFFDGPGSEVSSPL